MSDDRAEEGKDKQGQACYWMLWGEEGRYTEWVGNDGRRTCGVVPYPREFAATLIG